MKNSKLDLIAKHQKMPFTKGENRTTSVSLEKRHLEFLRDNRINLSSFLREKLDQLMESLK